MEDIKQGSHEWLEQRRGMITSSEVWRLMGEPKTKEGKALGLSDTAISYIYRLIGETFGGSGKEVESIATRWGHEMEPLARHHYQKITGIAVHTTGFIKKNEHYGGSPDGVSEGGGQEFKCPFESGNHVWHVRIKSPEDIKHVTQYNGQYYWQCLSNAHILQSSWWDFCSFDPRINESWGLFIYRINIADILADMERMINQIDRAISYKLTIMDTLKVL